MKTTPPVRVHNQALSLWQSVVEEQALAHLKAESSKEKAEKLTLADVQDDPMVQGTATYVKRAFDSYGSNILINNKKLLTSPSSDSISVHLSELAFRIAHASQSVIDIFKGLYNDAKAHIEEIENLVHEYEAAIEEVAIEVAEKHGYRKYSEVDPRFLTCEKSYVEYYKKYHGVLKYNSWKDQNNDLKYGVIKYRIPNNAKVAIIGDWGTGMSDAKHLLITLMNQHEPDIIIHLGDIYYSASPTEVYSNFANTITQAFNKTLGTNKRIPVFNIPGNHDYYCFGYELYKMVKGLNSFNEDAKQKASYFCLKTEDDGWQFLGMDTGYDDAVPLDQFNPFAGGPQLHASEVQWHQDKLNKFDGATILLSHHQLFSHIAKINGQESRYSGYPNMNKGLLDVFQPYFKNKVAAWLWGHEHNQVMYQSNLYGLGKGRLIGASAFEEAKSDDPYEVKYPNCPYKKEYKLGKHDDFYNHGYAIINFGVRKKPTDPVKINYYQYPSWGRNAPNPIPTTASKIHGESLKMPTPENKKAIKFKEDLHLSLEDGLDCIGPNKSWKTAKFPSVSTKSVKMRIKNSNDNNDTGKIKDGDKVYIVSEENGLGSETVITAVAYHRSLFYDKHGKHHQNWHIMKAYPSNDDTIYEDDPVIFKSTHYTGQYMCPFIETGFDGIWLSTDSKVRSKWFLKKT